MGVLLLRIFPTCLGKCVTTEGCFPNLKRTCVAKFVGGDWMCIKLGVKRVKSSNILIRLCMFIFTKLFPKFARLLFPLLLLGVPKDFFNDVYKTNRQCAPNGVVKTSKLLVINNIVSPWTILGSSLFSK
jgi:hypothetical protein